MAALCSSVAWASYPDGYYDSLDGKSGLDLKRAVKAVAASHRTISYGTSTWSAFRSTDVKTVNGTDYWWDMYSSNLVRTSGHDGMNIEHSVANSWWGKTKNDAYKDIVHLNPSDATANSRKSNYPLSEIAGEPTWTNGVTNVGRPVSGQGGGSNNVFEPHDDYKGDFARAFLYMFTIYDDISWKTSGTNWMYDTQNPYLLKDWAADLLLKWNMNDPVSDKERDRNDGIEKEQENRNPFIDLPDLAEYIWGSRQGEVYRVDGAHGGEDPQPPHPGGDTTTYEWLSQQNTALDAGWTIENVTMEDGVNYVWKWKEYEGKGYLNGSAYVNGSPKTALAYAWSPEVDLSGMQGATLSFSHAAKFQTTLRDLCGVVVKNTETGEISQLESPKWPGAGSWTFTSSGDMDLSAFIGDKVRVGLRYESDASGADTWEIRDMKLTAVAVSTVIGTIADTDDSFLVEVWGNSILVPDGARVFDMNGREVSGENLQKGIYIVVKPGFKKAVKVMIL